LPGFKTMQQAVTVTAPGLVTLDFVLDINLCAISDVLYVVGEPEDTWRESSLATHVLILSRNAQRRSDVPGCEHPYEYTVTLIRELKNPSFDQPTGGSISILTGLELSPGDEYVAWLFWNSKFNGFVVKGHGGEAVLSRVRDGRIGPEIPGVPDGATIDEFFATLATWSKSQPE
jgi:hypothetical protein